MKKRGDELGEMAPLLRAAQPLGELSAGERARVKACIRGTLRRSTGAPRILRLSRVVAAAAFVLMGAGALSAAVRYGIIPWIPTSRRPAPASPTANAEFGARPKRPTTVKNVPVLAPEAAIVSPSPSESSPRPLTAVKPTSLPVPTRVPGRALARAPIDRAWPTAAEPVSPAPSTLTPAAFAASVPPFPSRAEPAPSPKVAPTPVVLSKSVESDEHMALGRALRRLRHDHDAEGALTILGDLARSHPGGSLALERGNLEVEALLTLGRDEQALARLDGMALDELPRGAERRVVRGELRARARRWAEARDDFEHALSQASGQPAWRERALWGRAVTGLRLKDQASAHEDLRRYLELYPAGDHATEARRLLSTP